MKHLTRQGSIWHYSKCSKRYWSNKTLLDNLIILWTKIPIPLPILRTRRQLCSISKTSLLMDHLIPFLLSQIYGQFKPVATEGVSSD